MAAISKRHFRSNRKLNTQHHGKYRQQSLYSFHVLSLGVCSSLSINPSSPFLLYAESQLLELGICGEQVRSTSVRVWLLFFFCACVLYASSGNLLSSYILRALDRFRMLFLCYCSKRVRFAEYGDDGPMILHDGSRQVYINQWRATRNDFIMIKVDGAFDDAVRCQ